MGSESTATLMSSLGFGGQDGGQTGSMTASRGNGLLNALSATSRSTEARSPPGLGPGKIASACFFVPQVILC